MTNVPISTSSVAWWEHRMHAGTDVLAPDA